MLYRKGRCKFVLGKWPLWSSWLNVDVAGMAVLYVLKVWPLLGAGGGVFEVDVDEEKDTEVKRGTKRWPLRDLKCLRPPELLKPGTG